MTHAATPRMQNMDDTRTFTFIQRQLPINVPSSPADHNTHKSNFSKIKGYFRHLTACESLPHEYRTYQAEKKQSQKPKTKTNISKTNLRFYLYFSPPFSPRRCSICNFVHSLSRSLALPWRPMGSQTRTLFSEN